MALLGRSSRSRKARRRIRREPDQQQREERRRRGEYLRGERSAAMEAAIGGSMIPATGSGWHQLAPDPELGDTTENPEHTDPVQGQGQEPAEGRRETEPDEPETESAEPADVEVGDEDEEPEL